MLAIHQSKIDHVEQSELPEIRRDLKNLDTRLTRVEVKLDVMAEDIRELKADMKEVKSDVKDILIILSTKK